MGDFLAVSAFKGVEPGSVAQSVTRFLAQYEVAVADVLPDSDDIDPHTDCRIYPPEAGWTRLIWPVYFNVHDLGACEWISRDLACLVSTIHVYDSEYWVHGLFQRGEELDKFSSMPTYHEEDPGSGKDRQEWGGRPGIVASALGIPTGSIAGYMVDATRFAAAPEPARTGLFGLFGRKEPAPAAPRVHPDDESALDDCWVFADFWQRAGIRYPDDLDAWVKLLRMSEEMPSTRLPTSMY